MASAALVVVVAAMVIIDSSSSGSGTSRAQADSPPTTVVPAEQPVDASLFAAGSCVSLAPTRGDRHLTVFLDAGHGGIDPGGVGSTESGATIYEADETLPVELDAASVLRAEGFRVVVSRTGNENVTRLTSADVSGNELSLLGAHDDVAARDQCADQAHAQLLIGIYFDAGASASNAGSVTGYDDARSFSTANHRFATLLDRDVVDAMNAKGWQIPDEGVVPDTGLGSLVTGSSGNGLAAAAASYDHLLLLGPADPGYFTTPSDMPGALIEPLYLTDPFEGSIAASIVGQQTIAGGIAMAVEQYFAPRPVSTVPVSTVPTSVSPSTS